MTFRNRFSAPSLLFRAAQSSCRAVSLLVWCVATLSLLPSCETDSYDKGQGKYSLMQADLADLTVDGQRQGVSFVTDDDSRYTLTPAVTASWIQTADTVYRVMIYFNQLTETTAEQVALGIVPTMSALEHWRIKEQPTDPIGLESAWLSKNRKYLNLGLMLKTGQVDGNDGIQTIGLAQDTILVNDDNTRTAYYRFLHSQQGVPEYYTSRRYVSILLPQEERPDTVCLSLNTYDGVVRRLFPLR